MSRWALALRARQPSTNVSENNDRNLCQKTDNYLFVPPELLNLSIGARRNALVFCIKVLLKFLQLLMTPVDVSKRPAEVASLVV